MFSGATLAPNSFGAIVAEPFDDGGLTWGPAATFLISDGSQFFDDKASITADPTNSPTSCTRLGIGLFCSSESGARANVARAHNGRWRHMGPGLAVRLRSGCDKPDTQQPDRCASQWNVGSVLQRIRHHGQPDDSPAARHPLGGSWRDLVGADHHSAVPGSGNGKISRDRDTDPRTAPTWDPSPLARAGSSPSCGRIPVFRAGPATASRSPSPRTGVLPGAIQYKGQ